MNLWTYHTIRSSRKDSRCVEEAWLDVERSSGVAYSIFHVLHTHILHASDTVCHMHYSMAFISPNLMWVTHVCAREWRVITWHRGHENILPWPRLARWIGELGSWSLIRSSCILYLRKRSHTRIAPVYNLSSALIWYLVSHIPSSSQHDNLGISCAFYAPLVPFTVTQT